MKRIDLDNSAPWEKALHFAIRLGTVDASIFELKQRTTAQVLEHVLASLKEELEATDITLRVGHREGIRRAYGIAYRGMKLQHWTPAD